MGLWSFYLCLILCFASTWALEDKQSDRRGKALKISKKPCKDPSGRKGICVFKWDCINHNGTLMGTCVDGFIFGTCCHFDVDINLPASLPDIDSNKIDDDHKIHTTTPKTMTTRKTTRLTSPATTARPLFTSTGSATQHQLITWTSIGPTRRPRPPIVIQPFPFRPGTNFQTIQAGWPVGVAFPVNPLQVNRPLHVFRPSLLVQSAQNNVAMQVPGGTQAASNIVTTGNISFSILDGPDKITEKEVETTTIFVPIPQWSTTQLSRPMTSNDLPVQTTISSLLSFSSNLSTLSSTGRPLRNLDYRKDCGVRALGSKARIVGGHSSSFGRWPWQVLVKEAAWLGLYQKNKCGGVLISSRHAITAGHCQPGRFLSALVVILGEHNLLSDSGQLRPEMRRVRRMIVHRQYNPQNFDNDIAILELDSPVIFRPHISPICLPASGEDFTGKVAYVSGWGKMSHGGSIPNLLQEVQVPIMDNKECVSMFREAGHSKLIKDTFLCAGYKKGGKDSCEGDSGGPLMVERPNGQWVLAGTVSHGIRCADPNLPGVYMRISAYRTWIDKIIK